MILNRNDISNNNEPNAYTMQELTHKLFFITGILLNLFLSGQQISVEDVQTYNNGKEKFILYNNQKFSGQYIQDFDTIKVITIVKNGVIKAIEEKNSNYIALSRIYKSGNLYKKLYRDGRLIQEGTLINDYDRNKKWTSYYHNGIIKSREYYHSGRKVGKWKYYDNRGNRSRIIYFKNEVPFPISKEIHGNRMLIEDLSLQKENCKNTQQDISFHKPDYNCSFIYYDKGLKYTGYAVYNDKIMIFIDEGKAAFSETLVNGKISEFSYINDKLEKHGAYLKFSGDGKISVRGHHKNGDKSGDWIEYYNSGKIQSKKRYRNNKPQDWWFYYSEAGDNTKIEIYADGKLKTIGKPVYERRKRRYLDVNTVFYNADTNKPLYQKKERHFKKNDYISPLEYIEL